MGFMLRPAPKHFVIELERVANFLAKIRLVDESAFGIQIPN
jgi:hypothetical protein